MDPGFQSQSQSPDTSDVKLAFRKPLNDAANRKYRRRSPLSGSPSSSTSGSPKRDRGFNTMLSRAEATMTSDDRGKTRNESDYRRKTRGERDLNRDSSPNHSGKLSYSYKHSERQSSGNSHDHHRHDDSSRHRRQAIDEEKNYQKFSSRSGQESRDSTHFDYVRQDGEYDRSIDNWRSSDKYSRDRYEDRGPRSKDKDRDKTAHEHHHHKDKDSSFERERNRDRDGSRDDKRDHRRSLGNYKNDKLSSYAEYEGRQGGLNYSKDTHKGSSYREHGRKEYEVQRRKNEDREDGRHKERYNREQEVYVQNDRKSSSTCAERGERNRKSQDKTTHVDEDKDSPAKKHKSRHSDKAAGGTKDGNPSNSTTVVGDEKLSSSSKQALEPVAKGISEPVQCAASETEATHNLNAAKVAAMKAAELVNKNLVGSGFMTADQKKKLLWGNKKNTTTEESANQWDTALFADRERQEKFNKLMSLRLPWYLWPIVGCERKSETRAEIRKPRWQRCYPIREAEGTPTGPGEAVHCRAPATRWKDGRTRAIITLSGTILYSFDFILTSILIGDMLRYRYLSTPFENFKRTPMNRIGDRILVFPTSSV